MMPASKMNPTEKHARVLLGHVPTLQRRCDFDLLMFFAKHPQTLMGSEQLAKLLGYELKAVAQSLDVLLAAGLLTRTQNPTRTARLYEFATDEASLAWLPDFVAFASTRQGRLALRRALPACGSDGLPAKPASGWSAQGSARPFLVSRQTKAPTEPITEQPDRGER
jgi:hypothetical protein